MLGSVLICGASKKARLEKARSLLLECGFRANVESPDLLVVQKDDERKSIGILQAKEVKKFLRERPFEKKVKAVLVEDAQLLTDSAQGSLLKILEEPPVFGLVILLCDKEGSLLPTVVSRCQKVNVRSGKVQENVLDCNVARLSSAEIFDLARDLSAKGRDEAIEFLENVLRNDAVNGSPLQVVQKTEQSIKELRGANVALKFALEYLFLLHKPHVW